MALRINQAPAFSFSPSPSPSKPWMATSYQVLTLTLPLTLRIYGLRSPPGHKRTTRNPHFPALSAARLDLTEENIRQVLADARTEFAQVFDTSVGMTGEVDLVDLDGPFVKLSLRGRFWHKRSMVLERLANYLKIRIPEILEVDIEDEKQLDDSPENF